MPAIPQLRTSDLLLRRFPLALGIADDNGESVLLDLNDLETTLRFIREQFPTLWDKVVGECNPAAFAKQVAATENQE